MSFTFDPYSQSKDDVQKVDDVLMTNPTALQELEAYWRSLPRTRGVPNRRDVDPSNMAALLEDSFVLERVAPTVTRIRVAGRNIAQLIGIDPRGLPFTTLMNYPSRKHIADYIEQAFAGPHIVEVPLTAPRSIGQPTLHGKVMLLPLRDDHGVVNRLLGIIVMSGRRGVGGRRFDVNHTEAVRVDPVFGFKVVDEIDAPVGAPDIPTFRPNLATPTPRAVTHTRVEQNPDDGAPNAARKEPRPYLRLVVSNP